MPGCVSGPFTTPQKKSFSEAGSAISLGALDLGMGLKGEKHLGIGRGTLQGDVHQSLHRPQDLLRVAPVEIAFELQIEVFLLSANRYLRLHVKIPPLKVSLNLFITQPCLTTFGGFLFLLPFLAGFRLRECLLAKIKRRIP
jgi:hypothetical protein